MKCIKLVKSTKNVEAGEIKRVKESEAESEVKGGYWKYVPKSEWKLYTGKVKQSVDDKTRENQPSNSKKTKNEKNS